jgi:hypothetical protein
MHAYSFLFKTKELQLRATGKLWSYNSDQMRSISSTLSHSVTRCSGVLYAAELSCNTACGCWCSCLSFLSQTWFLNGGAFLRFACRRLTSMAAAYQHSSHFVAHAGLDNLRGCTKRVTVS